MATTVKDTRMERDSIGEIEVPADRYWGAQTARSLIYFAIVPHHLNRDHRHRFALRRIDLAGHDRRAGLVGRQYQLPEYRTWP